MIVLRQTVDSAIAIHGRNQSCGGIGLAVIEPGDTVPIRGNLKTRVQDDDLVGILVENFRKHKLRISSVVNPCHPTACVEW